MNIYLEVSIHDKGFEIYDHTHFVTLFESVGKAWEINDMHKRFNFRRVEGKQVNYHITGLKTYEQCKQFAIWYHVNKASGNISTYRLD